MTDVTTPDPFAPEQLDAAWQRALQLCRAAGYDPDELVAQAAANLEAWKRDPAGMKGPQEIDAPDLCWLFEPIEIEGVL